MIDEYGSEYLYENIPKLLAPLVGQVRENLEWRFMRLASDPSSDFNLHLFRASPLEPTLTSASSSSHSATSAPATTEKHTSSLRRTHSGRSSIPIPSGKGSFWLGVGPTGFVFHEVNEALPVNGYCKVLL